ncbi:MAG: MFS transporter [Litoreibacter sp.]
MKLRSLTLLLLAQVGALSLWFISSAILPAILLESEISNFRQAALSSGVQAGFVIGAVISAILGLADRYDPRRLFAICAISAGIVNLALLVTPPGSALAISARIWTGILLAGVYPVGMKIAVGWGEKDRGLLVGALVGALTLGSAVPHLFVFMGGANWRVVVAVASVTAMLSGLICLATALGPYHSKASQFNPKSVLQAWTNRRVRLAYLGYLGHMWELYAMWAWVAAIALASYSATRTATDAQSLATLTAFVAISTGAPLCLAAGFLADRFGKENVAMASMFLSATFAILAAVTFGGPVWLSFIILVAWGMAIIPDSALFSALVADAAPPEYTGSLMTLQTALGFALTFVTVQAAPTLAALVGWPVVLVILALGPMVGIKAMLSLRRLNQR